MVLGGDQLSCREPVSQTYCRLSSEHRITVFMECQLSWGGFLGDATAFESSLLSNPSSLYLWVTPSLYFKSWVQYVQLVAVVILVCGGFPFWSRYVCAVFPGETCHTTTIKFGLVRMDWILSSQDSYLKPELPVWFCLDTLAPGRRQRRLKEVFKVKTESVGPVSA